MATVPLHQFEQVINRSGLRKENLAHANVMRHSLIARSATGNGKQHQGDSNLCGQSPMDFESISLTARTHCHMFTENNGLLWIRWLPHRCERLWHSEGSCLVPSVTQPSGWSRLNNSKKLSSIMLEQALEGIEQTVCPRIGAPK